MKLTRKLIFSVILIITVMLSAFFCGSAAESKKAPYENLQRISSEILSVSYRGDTANYPDNSLEGVISAFGKGADMVSVNVMKTADGVFILCEDESLNNICKTEYESLDAAQYDKLKGCMLYDNTGKLTEYTFTTVEELIKNTKDDQFLILDCDWQYRDELYALIRDKKALDRAFLRTKQSASDICEWVSSKDVKPYVIGVYDGGIIFNAISHVNKLSSLGMPLVQYQSKNYFNVMYGSIVCDNFLAEGKAAAIAPFYSADLSGQRSDSQAGWDELIDKGYTVIETNNTEQFGRYNESRDALYENISVLTDKALKVDKTLYSFVSVDNLNSATEKAQQILSENKSSLNEMQSVYSQLISAMNNLMIKTGDDTQKGALNVTGGKIIAAVLVVVSILGGEFYMHKMHVRNKKKK